MSLLHQWINKSHLEDSKVLIPSNTDLMMTKRLPSSCRTAGGQQQLEMLSFNLLLSGYFSTQDNFMFFPAKMNLIILQSATRGQSTRFLDRAKSAFFVVSSWKLEKMNWKNKLFHRKVCNI